MNQDKVLPKLVDIIAHSDPAIRDQPLFEVCKAYSEERLFDEIEALESFWRSSDNLYEKVRALVFL